MPVDIEQLLSTALAQVKSERERDDLEARFKKLEDRNISMPDVIAALENASDDELEALRGTVLARPAAEVLDDRDDDNNNDDDNNDRRRKPKPPPRRTRPGRKSGAAYDWWVDDDGNVIRLDVARVYTGEDEPDEVPLVRAAEQDDADGD